MRSGQIIKLKAIIHKHVEGETHFCLPTIDGSLFEFKLPRTTDTLVNAFFISDVGDWICVRIEKAFAAGMAVIPKDRIYQPTLMRDVGILLD